MLGLIIVVVLGELAAACTPVDYAGTPHCYSDVPGADILPNLAYVPDSEISPERCVQACGTDYAGSNIFGLSDRLCSCGNPSTLKLPANESTGCNIQCPGDKSKLCGGPGQLLSLYMCEGVVPINPPVHSPPSPMAPVNPAAPRSPRSVEADSWGASDVIGAAIVTILIVGTAAWVLGLLVFVFILKREGPERVPARGALVGVGSLVSDGAGFITSSMRGLGRRDAYDEK